MASKPPNSKEPRETRDGMSIAFERFETKSYSEAVDVLFAQALSLLPVVTTADVRRICAETLKYQVEQGQRHVMGSADELRAIITWNLERAPEQLYPGQRIIGFQVSIQSQLQFAALSIVVGDARGSPGYMFGARLWRTTDQVFVQGWEGFETSPLAAPKSQDKQRALVSRDKERTSRRPVLELSQEEPMERLRCKGCGEHLVKVKTEHGEMDAAQLVLFFKMVGQPDPLDGYVCGACGKSSSFELVES